MTLRSIIQLRIANMLTHYAIALQTIMINVTMLVIFTCSVILFPSYSDCIFNSVSMWLSFVHRRQGQCLPFIVGGCHD
jgi:hypothetical protein